MTELPDVLKNELQKCPYCIGENCANPIHTRNKTIITAFEVLQKAGWQSPEMIKQKAKQLSELLCKKSVVQPCYNCQKIYEVFGLE